MEFITRKDLAKMFPFFGRNKIHELIKSRFFKPMRDPFTKEYPKAGSRQYFLKSQCEKAVATLFEESAEDKKEDSAPTEPKNAV